LAGENTVFEDNNGSSQKHKKKKKKPVTKDLNAEICCEKKEETKFDEPLIIGPGESEKKEDQDSGESKDNISNSHTDFEKELSWCIKQLKLGLERNAVNKDQGI
jgi:hypothetical protein